MAKHTFWNIGKANSEISTGHEEADKILTAAKISTLNVDGKDVPATDAPLAVKISAVSALLNSGDKTQDVSELIASNGVIAAQVEELTGKLTVANASVQSLSREKTDLEGRLSTATASVDRLTTEAGTNKNLLESSNKEVSRVSKEVTSQKTALARLCIRTGCLDLKADDGAAFPADASEDVKVAAVMKITDGREVFTFENLVTAYSGALNAAAARVGVKLETVPSGGGGAPANKGQKLSLDAEIAQRKAATKK
jgi:hypothetical protein